MGHLGLELETSVLSRIASGLPCESLFYILLNREVKPLLWDMVRQAQGAVPLEDVPQLLDVSMNVSAGDAEVGMPHQPSL